eukprot:353438-Chlamydomonas_euryale.AAC.14
MPHCPVDGSPMGRRPNLGMPVDGYKPMSHPLHFTPSACCRMRRPAGWLPEPASPVCARTVPANHVLRQHPHCAQHGRRLAAAGAAAVSA